MISVNPIYVAFVTVLVFTGVWLYALNSNIKNCHEQIKGLQVLLHTEKTQNVLHEVAISSQNSAIKTLEVDLNASTKKLQEWNALPQKVRYQVIYKEVIKENNLTGACDEVKTLINSVGSINLNSL